LRARWLKIAISLYILSKGSRAIYYLEKNPRSRIRGVGSSSQVIKRGTISLFYSYYLWEFGSFLCFYSFVVSLICNPNKYSRAQKGHNNTLSLIISSSVALELKDYLSDWGVLLCLLYENFIKCLSKKYSSLNKLGHLLTLGANHLLCVFGIGF